MAKRGPKVKFGIMHTESKYSDLNVDQRSKALDEIMNIEQYKLEDMWQLSKSNPDFTESYQFFITSPTSVAVKKK